ncbi:MAG: sigma 54-interacting transcriptional regulator [Gemmataceae bacterium]|nr:sigma 54-interacting transcriptional regulator [Gemmataceae bacterium]
MFLVSGQRRLLYANPAWETLTGLSFADARGRACRRRAPAGAVDLLELVLGLIAPPAEALRGRSCQTRRRAPGPRPAWWDIEFFPWSDADGPLAILGKIRVIHEAGPAHAVLPEKLLQLRTRAAAAYRLESWHGDAPVMQRLVAQLQLAAATRLPVLIHGPPGSGKEWAARTIHLLGEQHRPGEQGESFFAGFDARLATAALAELLSAARHWHIGTLYIKDVDRLPRDAQAMLVQRLETESGDALPRVLAGTTLDVEGDLRAGLVPELHGRLTALTIQAPPLTARLQDLPQLVTDLLARAGAVAGRTVRNVSPATMECLRQHRWPGNLAELYRVLVQACRRSKGDALELDDLPFYLRGGPAPPEQPLPLDDTLSKVERRMIELALRLAADNKSRAAEFLSIWRPRLIRRMQQLGLDGGGEDTDSAGAAAPPPNG